MADRMTPLERTLERLQGQPVDRIPNQNILMGLAAHYIGVTYSQYAQDYRLLVEASLRTSEAFHIDWVSVISDPMREASAFGALVHFPEDGVPYCEPLIHDYAQVDDLPAWDPWNKPRTADRLQALEQMHSRVGGYYPIGGWVEGAAAEAADLIGVNRFLEDSILEPDALHRLLERCNAQAIRFALAHLQAGANLIGIGDAVCSLLSPASFESLALPFEQSLIEAVHRACGLVKLHICGDTSRLLPFIAQTGADIIDVDWMVDYAQAILTCGQNASVNGNIDPVTVYRQGNPELVEKAVNACMRLGSARSFISAGCEIPVDTPPENLVAHYEALGRVVKAT
ncbi:MAG: uroporphyrinogen decarboxylase family protein [Anaerolineae bacterium]